MSRRRKNNIIRFIGSTEPTVETDNVMIGDQWYNTNKGVVCNFIYNNGMKYWDCLYSNVAFIAGGHYGGTPISSIEKVQFPFDSGNSKIVCNLTSARITPNSLSSSRYGYSCGGYSSGYTSTVDKLSLITFGNTVSVGKITSNKDCITGCNSTTYGYVLGGYNGSSISTIDRFAFPFDSGNAVAVGTLTAATNYGAPVSSTTHGYMVGGDTISTIQRILFPFNSGTSSSVGSLPIADLEMGGCESSIHGFCAGGNLNKSGSFTSNINRLLFPFNSGVMNVVGYITQGRTNCNSFNSTSHGFCCDGAGANYYPIIDRWLFPFNSGIATLVGNTETTRQAPAAADNTLF